MSDFQLGPEHELFTTAPADQIFVYDQAAEQDSLVKPNRYIGMGAWWLSAIGTVYVGLGYETYEGDTGVLGYIRGGAGFIVGSLLNAPLAKGAMRYLGDNTNIGRGIKYCLQDFAAQDSAAQNSQAQTKPVDSEI